MRDVRHPMRRAVRGAVLIALTVSGCGSADGPASAPRDVAIDAFEYGFSSDEAITIEAGDTIRFTVRNTGTIRHQMEVLSDASRTLGKTDEIAAGATGAVTVTFEEAGVYTVFCDIDDHRSRGQQSRFEVTDAAAP